MSSISTPMPSNPGLARDACLAAVAAHDARMDGAFVYAVRSTGIYCRPSCPSRRPRAQQLLFFEEPGAAEKAGFRPCLRCLPRLGRENAHTEFVRRVCEEIEGHDEGVVSLNRLAKRLGITASHIQRTFRRATGITPRQYADALRVARFKSELRKGKDVTTALHEVSYGSSSRLYEKSDAQLGMTPATYRRGGQGMKISYTIAPCSLGRVLVGVTERGISAVYLSDNDSELVTALRNEYPKAEIRAASGEHSNWVRAIVRHIAGTNPQLNLPTDVVATAFQRRVWEALQAIPLGSTRTYSQVARSIGKPSAIRAVARACATNPTAIVVPCHRVVRSDGSLAGYRWGVQRKRSLLERERQNAIRAGKAN